MKKLLQIISIVILISCKQDKIESSKKVIIIPKKIVQVQVQNKDTIIVKRKIKNIGYYDEFEKRKKLKFDSITEIEFEKYDKKKEFLTQPKILKDNNHFYIKTNKENHKFKVYKNYGGKESWSGNEFLGFYYKLNLFAITSASVSEDLGFSELFLLDKNTNYQYNIISFGDGAVELPIPSKNNIFLVYYYNSVYEHQNCDIGVLKINSDRNPE